MVNSLNSNNHAYILFIHLRFKYKAEVSLSKFSFIFFYKFLGDIWDDKIIIFEINKTLVEKLPETEHK